MAKAHVYNRFSDRRDSEHCQSNENQLAACQNYCGLHGHEIVRVCQDEAVSGAEEDRPILWDCIATLKRGMVLVVYRADRLARSVYLHELIYREVRKRGASIEVVDGSRNGDSAEDELMRTILAGFAAYERRVISARTKAAIARRQANGIAVSNTPPYGKMWGEPNRVVKEGVEVEQKTWVDDPVEQEIIARIVEMRRLGCGKREIARRLNDERLRARGKKFSHVLVMRILGRSGISEAKSHLETL